MKSLALILLAQAGGPELCGERADIVAALEQEYGERVRLGAINRAGGMLEFFGNEDSETWTLTLTAPGGDMCLIAAGEGFALIAPGEPV